MLRLLALVAMPCTIVGHLIFEDRNVASDLKLEDDKVTNTMKMNGANLNAEASSSAVEVKVDAAGAPCDCTVGPLKGTRKEHGNCWHPQLQGWCQYPPCECANKNELGTWIDTQCMGDKDGEDCYGAPLPWGHSGGFIRPQ